MISAGGQATIKRGKVRVWIVIGEKSLQTSIHDYVERWQVKISFCIFIGMMAYAGDDGD